MFSMTSLSNTHFFRRRSNLSRFSFAFDVFSVQFRIPRKESSKVRGDFGFSFSLFPRKDWISFHWDFQFKNRFNIVLIETNVGRTPSLKVTETNSRYLEGLSKSKRKKRKRKPNRSRIESEGIERIRGLFGRKQTQSEKLIDQRCSEEKKFGEMVTSIELN
jgi:hypothetical protein